MLIKTTLFFFFFINTLFAQENYIDFFLKEYNPVEGDIIFQDLDSSPLCSAIEEVTPGIFNQNFSHVGLIIHIENKFKIIESFSNGVKIVEIRDFLIRSLTDSGIPKITIARIHKEFQKKSAFSVPLTLIRDCCAFNIFLFNWASRVYINWN